MKIVACPAAEREKIAAWAARWNIPFSDEDYPLVYSSIINQGLTVDDWLSRQETTQKELKNIG